MVWPFAWWVLVEWIAVEALFAVTRCFSCDDSSRTLWISCNCMNLHCASYRFDLPERLDHFVCRLAVLLRDKEERNETRCHMLGVCPCKEVGSVLKYCLLLSHSLVCHALHWSPNAITRTFTMPCFKEVPGCSDAKELLLLADDVKHRFVSVLGSWAVGVVVDVLQWWRCFLHFVHQPLDDGKYGGRVVTKFIWDENSSQVYSIPLWEF